MVYEAVSRPSQQISHLNFTAVIIIVVVSVVVVIKKRTNKHTTLKTLFKKSMRICYDYMSGFEFKPNENEQKRKQKKWKRTEVKNTIKLLV